MPRPDERFRQNLARSLRAIALLGLICVNLPEQAQAAPAPRAVVPDAPTYVNNLSYDHERHSLVLDISGPVTISTRSLKSPPRLVVDIPAASLQSRNREMVVQDSLIKRVRLSQWKIYPPTVRVVIETAGGSEPLIAVQQTARKLYITLAPARGEEDASPQPHDHPPHTFTPPPTPTATPVVRQTPRALETPAPTPTPVVRQTPRPAPRWTPKPRPRPTYVPLTRTRLTPLTPALRPSPRPMPPRLTPEPPVIELASPVPAWSAEPRSNTGETYPGVP